MSLSKNLNLKFNILLLLISFTFNFNFHLYSDSADDKIKNMESNTTIEDKTIADLKKKIELEKFEIKKIDDDIKEAKGNLKKISE